MFKARLIEMFENMVTKKDSSLVPTYYDPEFVLTTNGRVQSYPDFLQGHERVYDTSISYRIRFDDSTWVESADRVAVRCWIAISSNNEPEMELELLLISLWRDGRILRLWELTWPDWSGLQALDKYDSAPLEPQNERRDLSLS